MLKGHYFCFSGSIGVPNYKTSLKNFSVKLIIFRCLSQESTLSDDSTPLSSSPKTLGAAPPETKYSYPYHTLSQSSDEVRPTLSSDPPVVSVYLAA